MVQGEAPRGGRRPEREPGQPPSLPAPPGARGSTRLRGVNAAATKGWYKWLAATGRPGPAGASRLVRFVVRADRRWILGQGPVVPPPAFLLSGDKAPGFEAKQAFPGGGGTAAPMQTGLLHDVLLLRAGMGGHPVVQMPQGRVGQGSGGLPGAGVEAVGGCSGGG